MGHLFPLASYHLRLFSNQSLIAKSGNKPASNVKCADMSEQQIHENLKNWKQSEQALLQIINTLGASWKSFQKASSKIISELPNIVEHFKKLPERQKEVWAQAAHYGWYPNKNTPIVVTIEIAQDPKLLDAFMERHLKHDWDDLTNYIISKLPNRKEILSNAFLLHQQGNYIASIPLFIAQADGICAQYLKAHLFTESEERQKRLQELKTNPNLDFIQILTHILGEKTQLSAGLGSASIAKKTLGPNRHGIMHGSRKHLDYGTRLNSLKIFSLLAFVVFVFCDEDNK